MVDKFSSFSDSLNSPPSHASNITPDDTADLPFVSRGVNVAGAGSLRITTVRGDIATLHVAAGIILPIRASRIWAAGTTATGIAVLW
jgi:hypothetical protein